MSKTADVVVIGAGVMGCGVAYWLSKEGYRVTVVEKESIASGASGVAAAILSEASPADGLAELSSFSIKLHREFGRTLQEESGVDFGYRENPAVHLPFTPDEANALRADAEARAQHGQPARWAERSALREVEPQASGEALGGLVLQQAQVLAYSFTLALAQAAERRGAEMRHGEAIGLESTGGRVTGVRLGNGQTLPAGCVVVAAGPWSQNASAWLGVDIPVYPVRGQILELRAPEPHLRGAISGDGHYVVHKANGLTLAGATEEHDSGFVVQTTVEGAREVMLAAIKLAPILERAELVNHVAGLRPGTRDGLPLIGPVPGWQGVYVVAGHFRRGMELSAGSTRIIAGLIAGRASPIPIDRFDPGRFGPALRK